MLASLLSALALPWDPKAVEQAAPAVLAPTVVGTSPLAALSPADAPSGRFAW